MRNGTLVRVMGNSVSHSYRTGKLYKIKCPYSKPDCFILINEDGSDAGGSFIARRDFEVIHSTRAEEADYLEKEALPAEECILAAQTKKVADIKADIVRLRTYPDFETEVAHLLSAAIKTGGNVSAIVDVLKSTGLCAKAERSI